MLDGPLLVIQLGKFSRLPTCLCSAGMGTRQSPVLIHVGATA
jgi:hypothetical protein